MFAVGVDGDGLAQIEVEVQAGGSARVATTMGVESGVGQMRAEGRVAASVVMVGAPPPLVSR